MLFGKKTCAHCDSEIDVAEATCPVCGSDLRKEGPKTFSNQMTWIPWVKQLIIFIVGLLGLNIAATVFSVIFMAANGDIDNAALTINFLSYLVIFCSLAALVWMHYKGLFKSFKRWKPYVFGLAGLGALLVFNMGYNAFIQAVHPITDNANETAVNSYILSSPVMAFFVIVIFGPVVEELTYRVGLFSLLSRVHIVLGYILTALTFAFIHFDWSCIISYLAGDIEAAVFNEVLINELLNIPLYIAAGVVFNFLYHKFGLASSLTAHMTNNLLSFMLVFLAGVING